MGTVTLNLREGTETAANPTIEIRCSVLDKDLCKMIPGSRWDADTSCWIVKASWSSCKALRGVFGDRLEIDPSVNEYAGRLVTNIIAPAKAARELMETDGPVTALRGTTKHTLYKYQEAGVEFLSGKHRAGLFDPMGTGKTAQIVTTLRLLNETGQSPFPALIVCPNGVKATWLAEFEQWAPDVRVIDAGNNAKERAKHFTAMRLGDADVMIINWEGLGRNSRLAAFGGHAQTKSDKTPGPLNEVPWASVVADEAHRGKNPLAKQTRALWAIAHDEKVRFRYALTGTPMANTPVDFWAILHMVDPDEFPSKTRWMDRYCLLGFGTWGGVEVLGIKPEMRDEFNDTTEYMWRRTPKEAALDLPPKVPVTREVKMTPSQARQYKAMADAMIVEMAEEGGHIFAPNAIARMTRLLQFASATATVVPKPNGGGETEVLLTAPSCKVDALLDILEDLDPNDQVVVFASSRKLIELAALALDKAKISYGLITGKVSVDERAKNVAKFQDHKLRVMLCTIAAGGVGITLTAASTMVFLQRSFSAVDNQQAEDRCHRIGSEVHESITIIDVLSEGTLDYHVMNIATAKKDALEDLVKDKERLRNIFFGHSNVIIETTATEVAGELTK